jgi:two-component system, OmpR family, copper resistance phosphate regulon response regulator CusR
MKKILLIEDDPHVCSFINKGLTEEGFEVSVAMTGETGLEMFQSFNYDLIILDIMLPNMSGIDVCKSIRNTKSEIPILFLTALGSSENIVMGLNTGADDYLVKPFKFIEMVARVKTLLRRSEKFNNDPVDKEILRFADIELDNYTKTVKRNGQEISLTSTEFRLLYMFMKNPKRVLSRAAMLDEVWGVNFDLGTNVVDVYVNYLRKKLDKYGKGKLIHTVIGMGYVLKDDEDAA